MKAGFFRLLGMNKPEWHWAIVGCASSAGLGVMMPAFALALSNILGVFYNTDFQKQKDTISTWCIVFAVVGAGALVCGTVQQFAFTLMGQKLTKRLRILLMQALMRQVGFVSCQHICLAFAAYIMAFSLCPASWWISDNQMLIGMLVSGCACIVLWLLQPVCICTIPNGAATFPT